MFSGKPLDSYQISHLTKIKKFKGKPEKICLQIWGLNPNGWVMWCLKIIIQIAKLSLYWVLRTRVEDKFQVTTYFLKWIIFWTFYFELGSPDSSLHREAACNSGDPGSIPASGSSTREGIGYPLQYSWVWLPTPVFLGFSCGSSGKESICNAGDLGSVSELGWSPGEGNGYPLQYSDLENSDLGSQRVKHDWVAFTISYWGIAD